MLEQHRLNENISAAIRMRSRGTVRLETAQDMVGSHMIMHHMKKSYN